MRMEDTCWKILLVEDDPEDHLLIKSWLSQVKNGQFQLTWANSYQTGLKAIEAEVYDVILVDYRLGSASGVDLIRAAQADHPHVPFILLTGYGNYEIDLTASEAGASDYLSKSEITPLLLERSIRYAIAQKQAEKELRKVYAKTETLLDERTEELIEARRKLIETVEAERKRLAQEIHDGPIQDLLGITLLMSSRSSRTSTRGLSPEVRAAVNRVVDSLREVCKELRADSSLSPYNLEDSIQAYTAEFQKQHPNLAVTLTHISDLKTFPERSRLAFYRIYQQALANVAFHARAKKVSISLIEEDRQAVLEIEDDGQGFVVPACLSDLALQGHFGLVGSQERATAVGGELEIESRPGMGTLVRAIIPAKTFERA
jgi:signal transduction histidine kinase